MSPRCLNLIRIINTKLSIKNNGIFLKIQIVHCYIFKPQFFFRYKTKKKQLDFLGYFFANRDNIFEMLATLKIFFQMFQHFIGNMTKKTKFSLLFQ